jgi:hypothetical protein
MRPHPVTAAAFGLAERGFPRMHSGEIPAGEIGQKRHRAAGRELILRLASCSAFAAVVSTTAKRLQLQLTSRASSAAAASYR